MQGCLCVCFWFIFHQVLCDTQKETVWTQLEKSIRRDGFHRSHTSRWFGRVDLVLPACVDCNAVCLTYPPLLMKGIWTHVATWLFLSAIQEDFLKLNPACRALIGSCVAMKKQKKCHLGFGGK